MKQLKITEQDYLKAHRKASREEEIRAFGKQITHRTKVQKSKKSYDRTGHKAALKKLPFSYHILNITQNKYYKIRLKSISLSSIFN